MVEGKADLFAVGAIEMVFLGNSNCEKPFVVIQTIKNIHQEILIFSFFNRQVVKVFKN